MKRLLVIGLDCANPDFVFHDFRNDLPNLSLLMKEGIYGELQSTIPPITIPAWTSMLSSRDPGQLGLYGFRNRKSYDYQDLAFANSSWVRDKLVWNYLEENGLTSILINIPQTFPPIPLKGIMVGCFLTPDKNADYTFPKMIKGELDKIADGDYIIDVRNFRTNDKDRLREEIYLMTRRRFKVIRHFLNSEPWDFFMFVEMGIDRIHHGFWRFHDRAHRLYQPSNPYQDVIHEYYVYVDEEIGMILNDIQDDTAIMVVSDHGAKRMEGGICINDLLIRMGYLKLNYYPENPARLTPNMIDWKNTMAWGEGGYYSRVFLNVKGREPEGKIDLWDYEKVREEIKKALEQMGDQDGKEIGTRVFRPEDIYLSLKGIPPDLIVYFGNLHWRGAGTVGNREIHIFENDTGPDDANHSEKGIFIFKGDFIDKLAYPKKGDGMIDGLSIYDIAPTIIDLFGIEVPPSMIGKSIFKMRCGEEFMDISEERKEPFMWDYSESEREEIRKRLNDLGYLE
jgi:predicted AlkP superfamily phosphohydrolase/phosphomutase